MSVAKYQKHHRTLIKRLRDLGILVSPTPKQNKQAHIGVVLNHPQRGQQRVVWASSPRNPDSWVTERVQAARRWIKTGDTRAL